MNDWGGEVYIRNNSDPQFRAIRDRLGSDFVNTLWGIDGYFLEAAMNRETSPEQLRQLLEFRPMRSFDAMSASKLDDDWVAAIPDPGAVQSLNLGGTAVTDRSIARFAAMPDLRKLNVEYTKISDEGIFHLLSQAHLGRLHVGGRSFRAIRLLEFQARPTPSSLTGRGATIGVKLAIDDRLGAPSKAEISLFRESGGSGYGGILRKSEPERSGEWLGSIEIPGLPDGRWMARIEITTLTAGQKTEVFCRLPVAAFDWARPESATGEPITERP